MVDKPKIMIVDDSETITRTARKFLEPDYEVFEVSNGFQALGAVIEIRPDMVFMDIMMPRLDGYSACLAIKSNPEFDKLPVVMLSSKDSPFDKARGAMMGGNDYLTKPFSADALVDAVRRHLPHFHLPPDPHTDTPEAAG